jgi:uncharacterized cupin superfamily protein
MHPPDEPPRGTIGQSVALDVGATRRLSLAPIVVAGTPTLRTPEGETALEAGDVVCFPVGPAGAHRVWNAGDGTVRVALFSNRHEFGIVEYPDSDKIGIWGRHDEALDHLIRRSPDLDYWEGER